VKESPARERQQLQNARCFGEDGLRIIFTAYAVTGTS